MTVDRPASSWARSAACRGLPVEMFFPPTDAAAGGALEVCARCRVRAECDRHAATAGEEYGIWGGRTETDRAVANSSSTPPRVAPQRRRSGPAPALSDDDLVELVWSLDPERPAAAQVLARIGVSVPTAYKYLRRGLRLGVVEQRGRHIYPAR